MSAGTELLQEFRNLITAFNTIVLGDATKWAVVDGVTKPSIAMVLNQYMQNNGWTPYQTSTELLATTPAKTARGAYAFDTKKVYRWGPVDPININGAWQWYDEGVNPLDNVLEAAKTSVANAMSSQGVGDRTNLVDVFGYTSGIYVDSNGVEQSTANWSVSKMIPVQEGATYRVRSIGGALGVSVVAGYKSDKSYHSTIIDSTTNNELYRDFVTPVGVRFVRVSFVTAIYAKGKVSLTKEVGATKVNLGLLVDQPNLLDGVTVQDGKYLAWDVQGENSGWVYTDYIPVKPNTRYITGTANSSVSTTINSHGISTHFYDADKTFIGVSARYSSGGSFETPDGCMFVVMNIIKAQSEMWLYEGDGQWLELNKQQMYKTMAEANILTELDPIAKYGIVVGKYINPEGIYGSHVNWSTTELIPVRKGDRFKYSADASGAITVVSAHDDAGVFIKQLVAGVGSTTSITDHKGEITIPDGVAQVRLSWYHVNRQATASVLTASVTSSGGSVVAKSRHDGKVWVALGDSITDHHSTSYTYPVYVANHFNFELYDGAISGNRTRQIFNRSVESSDVNLAKSDFVTIAHGTNDFKLETTLGSMADPVTLRYYDDTQPSNEQRFDNPLYADRNSTSGSFYADYRGAVEHILKTATNARLILITPIRRTQPAATGTDTNAKGHKLVDYVNAIKEIGAYYGLPVIDNYNESGFNDITIPLWTRDGLHPNEWAQRNVMANIVIGKMESL